MVELRVGQYQAGFKMLTAADTALQHAMSSVKRQEDSSALRRSIEEVESFLKKAKQQLKIG
ncbi:MAG: hypothetical protein IH969_06325 [Candidatus Krumholzibacteriota bacterium]|nr:hypothetical protein [Candidatus Krumholzibacteriota bacterium]